MAKYSIGVKRIEYYAINDIEADSMEEAIKYAQEDVLMRGPFPDDIEWEFVDFSSMKGENND